jgi:hypothetical protein
VPQPYSYPLFESILIMNSATPQDCDQQAVTLGDIVRVLTLSRDFIECFPEDEQILIESMIGKLFKVIAIDEEGQACVMREWHDERGQPQTHVIALDAHEMKKV